MNKEQVTTIVETIILKKETLVLQANFLLKTIINKEWRTNRSISKEKTREEYQHTLGQIKAPNESLRLINNVNQ